MNEVKHVLTGGIVVARKKYDLIRENELEKMCEMLKALANPTRLQIVNVLMKGERSVGDLVKTLATKQPIMSMQLRISKFKGILKARRNGNIVFYSFVNKSVRNIIESILKELS